MPRSVLAAAALAALLVPATAQAGGPFTIGQGSEPHIVMAPGGTTARALWSDEVAKKLHFCTIPRGATACQGELVIEPPGGEPDGSYLVNGSGNTVYIAVPHYAGGKTWVYTSPDGGASFGAPQQIYADGGGTDSQEPILDAAAGELIFPSTNPVRSVYSAELDTGNSAGTANAELGNAGVSDLRDLQLARLEGAGLVALAHNGDTAVFWRLMGGDPSVSGNWSAGTVIGEGDDARLTGADGAPWMMATVGPIGSQRVEARRWTGSAFGAPTVLANEKGVINDIAAAGSAVGAIWRNDLTTPDRLRFAVSTDNGASFGVRSIALEDSVMASMDLALATDGGGFAIFEGSGDTGSGAKRMIKVANTDAVAEPATPGTGGGSTTTPPATTPPPKPTPTTTPTSTTPLAVGRRVTTTSNGARITLGLPRGCIPAGRPFVATLTWRKQRRKGNKFVKITRTDFFIGTRRLKIDRRAPFRQTLRIPNPRRGQTYRFRARAFIKVRRGRGPKKSIVSTLRVCS